MTQKNNEEAILNKSLERNKELCHQFEKETKDKDNNNCFYLNKINYDQNNNKNITSPIRTNLMKSTNNYS